MPRFTSDGHLIVTEPTGATIGLAGTSAPFAQYEDRVIRGPGDDGALTIFSNRPGMPDEFDPSMVPAAWTPGAATGSRDVMDILRPFIEGILGSPTTPAGQATASGERDPWSIQGRTARSNLEIGEEASLLARKLTLGAASELNPAASRYFYEALNTAFPGYRTLFNQMQTNTTALLKGELPPDVVQMIRMTSAENRTQGALESTARNLGLSSLQAQEMGSKNLSEMFRMSKDYMTAPTMDLFGTYMDTFKELFGPSAMTPAQAGAMKFQAEELDYRGAQLALEKQKAATDAALSAAQTSEKAREFNASLAWEKEQAALQEKWTRYSAQMEQNLMDRAIGLASQNLSEQRANAGAPQQAFADMLKRILAPGSTLETPPESKTSTFGGGPGSTPQDPSTPFSQAGFTLKEPVGPLSSE